MNKIKIIGLTLSSVLLFMIVFPVAEFHINCPNAAVDPDGNEACIWLKHYLWTAVFILSMGQDGDGFALTEGLDEIHYRNIIPVMTVLLLFQFFENVRLTKKQ